MMSRRQVLVMAGGLLSAVPARARAAAASIKLASVKFGTVNWLIDTIRGEGLDKKYDIDLTVIEVANNQAGPVALLAGEADVIVSDWTWALRLRSRGNDLKFSPFSSALGSVMVPKDSPVKSLADLEGRKIGVAGTAIDKSWVLLRAYSKKMLGKDIANFAEPVYGAAPLVTEEFKNGRLDACLDFWTYAARLEGTGARQLLSMSDIINALEISPTPPLVGFVWSETHIKSKNIAIEKLLGAAREANELLGKSDAAWERIRPQVQAETAEEFEAIKAYFRSGIAVDWGDAETRAAEKMTNLLLGLDEAELLGNGTRFDPKLFHATAG